MYPNPQRQDLTVAAIDGSNRVDLNVEIGSASSRDFNFLPFELVEVGVDHLSRDVKRRLGYPSSWRAHALQAFKRLKACPHWLATALPDPQMTVVTVTQLLVEHPPPPGVGAVPFHLQEKP